MLRPTAYSAIEPAPAPRLTGALSTRNCYGRIIWAARDLMVRAHNPLFSVRDIAVASDLSPRAVYNHFNGPEALRRAVLRSMLDEVREGVEIDLPTNLPPEQAIPDFIRSALAVLSSEVNVALWNVIACHHLSDLWLPAAYHRLVRQPIITSLELYLLRRASFAARSADQVRPITLHLLGMIEAASVLPSLLRLETDAEGQVPVDADFIAASFLRAHLAAPNS